MESNLKSAIGAPKRELAVRCCLTALNCEADELEKAFSELAERLRFVSRDADPTPCDNAKEPSPPCELCGQLGGLAQRLAAIRTDIQNQSDRLEI